MGENTPSARELARERFGDPKTLERERDLRTPDTPRGVAERRRILTGEQKR